MNPTLVVLGGAVGGGLVLILSPLLWPRDAARIRHTDGSFTARIADRLTAAGFPALSPGVFMSVSGLLGAVAGALVFAFTSLWVVAVIALAAGSLGPWIVAGWRSRSRTRNHRVLWPEVVDHLVASVRAGQPLPDAIASLAVSGPVPFRAGFALFERRWHETGTVGVALDAVKARFADPTADRLFEILRMARQVGGTELPSVLRDLSLHLRQDLALRSEAEARQSWVTSTAKLGVAAPWIVLLLLATRPEAAAAYNTPAGSAIIVGALVLCVVAYRVMLLIGRLPEDRRWFR